MLILNCVYEYFLLSILQNKDQQEIFIYAEIRMTIPKQSTNQHVSSLFNILF